MSYILEALKRAEKERKLGQAPAALDEVAIPQADASPARRHWLLIGAGSILLIAGLAFGATRFFGSKSPSAPVMADAASTPPTATVVTAAPPANDPPGVADAQPAVVASDAATAEVPADVPGNAAQIEGSETIASLDDLTGDNPNTQQQIDNGSADDPEAHLPPSGPTVELGASQQPIEAAPPPTAQAKAAEAAAAAPAKSPKPVVIAKPKPAPAEPPARSSTSPSKATTSNRAAIAAAPSSPLTTSSAPLSTPSSTKTLRAPPAGPVVVLGHDPKVIEAAGNAPVVTRVESAATAAPVPIVVEPAPIAAAAAEAPPAAERTAEPVDDIVVAAQPAPASPAPSSRAPAEVPRASRQSPAAAAAPNREHSARIDSLRRFKEMPPAYRAEFPALTVDVHVYNADASRSFVIITGKRYRDGDTLTEGPHIDEIVSEGIVFDWRGEKVLYALGR